MKIIVPSVEIMRTGMELKHIKPEQFIEKVGRTCYKSEDKITDTSAATFVGNLIKRGHEAMIEHWNLIFKVGGSVYEDLRCDYMMLMETDDIASEDRPRPFLRFTHTYTVNGDDRYVISGNMRAWRDFVRACVYGIGYIPYYLHGLVRTYPLFFPEFQDHVPGIISNTFMMPISVDELVGDTERDVHMTVTAKFICDRGVSHEIVRHRVASFAQESTRYCNYGLDKFGKEITVIRPSWCNEGDDKYKRWLHGCLRAEEEYFDMLDVGCTPQEARSVLPNSTKTEIIVTMNLSGWRHFFDLRCATSAHPDIQEVAKMARELFETHVYAPIEDTPMIMQELTAKT